MSQNSSKKRTVIVCVIMLAILCFILFIAFGAVDVLPERLRQTQEIDPTKELLLTTVVWTFVLYIFFFFKQIKRVEMK